MLETQVNDGLTLGFAGAAQTCSLYKKQFIRTLGCTNQWTLVQKHHGNGFIYTLGEAGVNSELSYDSN